MKPAAFDYVRPASLDEALDVLAANGDDATIIAGGQSLMPLLNFRLARPQLLVDVNRVPGLDGVAAGGALELGALVRQADALASSAVAAAAPLLVRALRHVGHPATRSRGTVGGSVAHADPAAEIPAVLVALGGEVVLASRRGERVVAVEEFFAGRFVTARAPDELVVGIRAPVNAAARFGFHEIARRHGDFALAGAAVVLDSTPRVSLFGVGRTPVRARAVEQALAGGASPAEAADLASEGLEPVSDVHAPAAYRARMAVVATRRALEEALA